MISSIQDYETLKAEMIKNNNQTTLEYRKHLATKAFALTAQYDSNIYNWFLSQGKSNELPEFLLYMDVKHKDSDMVKILIKKLHFIAINLASIHWRKYMEKS